MNGLSLSFQSSKGVAEMVFKFSGGSHKWFTHNISLEISTVFDMKALADDRYLNKLPKSSISRGTLLTVKQWPLVS